MTKTVQTIDDLAAIPDPVDGMLVKVADESGTVYAFQSNLVMLGATISGDDGPIAYVEFTEDTPQANLLDSE